MNRLARMAVLTLALLCLFTIGAGVAMARLLPARLALFQVPAVSARGLHPAGSGLSGASAPPGTSQGSAGGGQATAAGVRAKLAPLIGGLGPDAGALVIDLRTGKALYADNATSGFTPASTTKIATAVAAIDVLGPQARFTT
jgi:serine-type D-Ala-D-Ala carboxypeptidase/endopeptidase (penicillin-binding protein 4)